MHLVKLVSLLFVSLLIGGSTPEKPLAVDQSKSANTFIVVLDAGHGGHDPGNLGNGYLEKKIPEDDPNYNFIHEIKRESKRCKKIVQDLLSYARTPKPVLAAVDSGRPHFSLPFH